MGNEKSENKTVTVFVTNPTLFEVFGLSKNSLCETAIGKNFQSAKIT